MTSDIVAIGVIVIIVCCLVIIVIVYTTLFRIIVYEVEWMIWAAINVATR